MTASSTFDSDDDFIFGVDFSKLDVSGILEETDVSSSSDSITSSDTPTYSIRVNQLLTSSIPKLETSAVKADYDDLFEWATELGAQLDGIRCYEDAYGGRGLASTIDYVEGDVVATLPRALRIGQTVACHRLGLPNKTPDLSALSLFLLDLVISDNKNDHFCHYATCLPRIGSNALFMNENEIQYYATFGESYSKAIKAICNQATSCMEYIRDILASDDFTHADSGLKWSISMVQSRTHGFGTKRSRWLTPVFDFANHSPSPTCKLEGDAEGRLVLRAVKHISIGEEITIDYQVSDDAKLVATYGFSLVHPPVG